MAQPIWLDDARAPVTAPATPPGRVIWLDEERPAAPRRQIEQIAPTDFGTPAPADLPKPAPLRPSPGYATDLPDRVDFEENPEDQGEQGERMIATVNENRDRNEVAAVRASQQNQPVAAQNTLTPPVGETEQNALPAPKPLTQVLEEHDAQPAESPWAERARAFTPQQLRAYARNPDASIAEAARTEWRRRYRAGDETAAGESVGKAQRVRPDEPEDTLFMGLGREIANTRAVWTGYGAGSLERANEAPQSMEEMLAENMAGTADVNARARVEGAREARRLFDQAQMEIAANAPNLEPGTAKSYATQILRATIDMAPTVATTIATKSPALGIAPLVGQVYGQQYGEARRAGRSPDKAALDAVVYSIAEGVPEMLPLHIAMKPGGSFLGKLGASSLGEGAQEAITEIVEAAYDKGTIQPDMTWGEAWRRIRDAGIVGVGAGLGIGAAGHAANTAADRVNEALGDEAFGNASAELATRQAAGLLSPDLAQMRLVPQSAGAPSPQPDAQPPAESVVTATPPAAVAPPGEEYGPPVGEEYGPPAPAIAQAVAAEPAPATSVPVSAEAPVAPPGEPEQTPTSEPVAPPPTVTETVTPPPLSPEENEAMVMRQYRDRPDEGRAVLIGQGMVRGEIDPKEGVRKLAEMAAHGKIPELLVHIQAGRLPDGTAPDVEGIIAAAKAGRQSGDLSTVLADDRPLEDIRAEQRPPIAFTPVKHDVAVTPGGKDVAVEYAIVDADSLIPSQRDDGSPNPDFPQGMQPRDRTRDASQLQIADLAQKLNPRLLGESPSVTDGAPIIDEAGIVESGNGRSLAIRRAYAMGLPTAELYRQHLAAQGYQIDGIAKPVLVRIRRQPMDINARAAFTREANERTTLGLSSTERAMSDARVLPDSAMGLWRGGEVTDAGNRDFVRSFVDAVVSPADRANMIGPDGAISQEGIRRIQSAMLAKAYGDPALVATLIETADNDIKAAGGALLEVAPQWAQMRGEAAAGAIDPRMDITAGLLEAIALIRRSRSEGRNIAEYLNQNDMFAGESISQGARDILRFFYTDANFSKPVRYAGAILRPLQFYVQEARKSQPGPGLFGPTDAVTPQELVATAATRGQGSASTQGNLLALPDTDPRARRGALRAGLDGPAQTALPLGGERSEPGGGQPGLRATRLGDGRPDGELAAPVAGPRLGRQRRGTPEPLTDANKDTTAANVMALIAKLRKAFGVTHRLGRITMRKAAGTYNSKSGVVRTKQATDIEVFAHEAGHHIDEMYGDRFMKMMTSHKDELEPLDYAPNRKDRKLALREGFAEWFSIYVTNPAYAKRSAPNFTAEFEGWMGKEHPAELADLKEIQAAYQTYLTAPSTKAVRAGVVTSDPGGAIKRAVDFIARDDKAEAVGALAAHIYRGAIDKTHPIHRGVQRLLATYERNNVGKDGKIGRLDLEIADDPAKLARLAGENHGTGWVDVMHGVVDWNSGQSEGASLADAVQKAMGPKGWNAETFADFNSYLVSRRAIHLWRRFTKGELQNEPTRESKADHTQNIADLEKANPQFKDAAKDVYDFANRLWMKKAAGGLITTEQFREGLMHNADYVPFLRDRTDLGKGLPGGHATNGKNSSIRQLRGSQRDIIFPIESLMRDAFQTERLLADNNVNVKLAELAEKAGTGGGAVMERIPNTQIEKDNVNFEQLKKAIIDQARLEGAFADDRDLTMLDTLLDQIGAPSIGIFKRGEINEKGEPIVYLWRNGKREAWRLADGELGREMHTALTGLDKESSNLALDAGAIFGAALRFGVTGDPAYQLVNIFRDVVQSAVMYDNPATILWRPIVRILSGAYSAAARDEAWQHYTAAGGIMGGATTNAFRNRPVVSGKEMARKGILLKRLGSWKDVMGLLEFSESAARLGLYKQFYKDARKRGLSEKDAFLEATYMARDYMDYGRNGSKTLWARKMITFVNANIQGLDKQVRHMGGYGSVNAAIKTALTAGKRPLTGTEKRQLARMAGVWTNVAVLGLIGLAISAAYKDDPEYEEISEELRANSWMIKWGDEWIALPKPFQWAFLSNIFERVFERYYHDDPTAIDKMWRGLASMFAPPMIPPIVKAPMEVWANKATYDGRPIVPTALLGLPPEQRVNSYTSSFGRWLGSELGVSPIVIDHYITSGFGSLGRTGLAITTQVDPNAPSQGLEDMMVLRRFFRDWTRGAASQRRFYEEVSKEGGRMTGPLNFYRDLKAEKKYVAAVKYLDTLKADQRVYALWRENMKGIDLVPGKGSLAATKMHPLQRVAEIATAITSTREEVRNSKTLTPDQKRDLDDLLSARAVGEMRNAMIVTGTEGYKGRAMMDEPANLARIKAIDPKTAQALAAATRHAPSFESVEKFYPKLVEITGRQMEQLRRLAKEHPEPTL